MQLGREMLSIETGKVAKQADGSAWIQYGGTVVLVTAVADRREADKDLREALKGRFGPFSVFPYGKEGEKQAHYLMKFLFAIRVKHLKRKGIDE